MELTELKLKGFEVQQVTMETEMLMSLKYKNAYKSNMPLCLTHQTAESGCSEQSVDRSHSS